ncbi:MULTISPECIES: DUF4915 domain-containing protein [unclassified Mesorhizobium]|uniref:DUF4915 domain-containing protein n=3 Tax=Mesorhizobium TaxID=68287 RepID=UPI001673759E|nr:MULTISPECIES: DUF4915 domain-containing protein [unclassified Mesorhizobium]
MSDGNDAFQADHQAWRDPASVVAQWQDAGAIDSSLLEVEVTGPWWQSLAEAGVTLLVSREYEHLLLALSMASGSPQVSYLRLPHPSGIAFDAARGEVHVASTRNPNVLYTLRAADGLLPRRDLTSKGIAGNVLMPAGARFLPGSTYLHDLAMIGPELHGSAVGENAIVAFPALGGSQRVWWPSCIEGDAGADFGLNHLQLNGIAAGKSLAESCFTASKDDLVGARPGQIEFAVEGRGVIFSGATRLPMTRGLTRPHSPRFVSDALWVANSGFGSVVSCGQDGSVEIVARLRGWTRGLCAIGNLAIVGTSRIIPRFRAYAPGLEPDRCVCGLHAVDIKSGRVVASLVWPAGNQIFAIEAVPSRMIDRLPFDGFRRMPGAEQTLFYAWQAGSRNDVRRN